jgi:hypothetical protein
MYRIKRIHAALVETEIVNLSSYNPISINDKKQKIKIKNCLFV